MAPEYAFPWKSQVTVAAFAAEAIIATSATPASRKRPWAIRLRFIGDLSSSASEQRNLE
jgi:hypothetical protein